MAAVFTKRRVIVAAIILTAGTGLAIGLRPRGIVVETATVHRGALRVTVDADGRTRVRDRYVITAPIAGRLERTPLVEGTLVRVGDVVARIAPTPVDEPSARQARARLAAARASAAEAATRVDVANAAFVQARRDAERARRLADAGAISPQALEAADLAARSREEDLDAARARTVAAHAEVRQATAALLYAGGGDGSDGAVIPVRTPSAGRVLRLAERSERVVAPGTPIAEIGDTRRLEVVVDVLSSDAARVAPGMAVLLENWGGEDAVRGRVRLVEPAATTRVSALGVEEQRVNVVVDVDAPPPALGDGFRVDARIVVWEGSGVLTVPSSALVRAGDDWAVYAVDRGRARLRTVRVAHIGDAAAEVVSGLADGARVILFPSDKVQPGIRVVARQ